MPLSTRLGAVLLLTLFPLYTWAACSPADLKTELQTNPANLSDGASVSLSTLFAAGKDADVLTVMNQVRNGAPYQVDPAPVAVADLKAVLDPAEYLALTDHQLLQLTTILGSTTVDLTKASIRAILVGAGGNPPIVGIFANPSATRTALIGMVKRQGSRAEVVCGRLLRLDDISAARDAT